MLKTICRLTKNDSERPLNSKSISDSSAGLLHVNNTLSWSCYKPKGHCFNVIKICFIFCWSLMLYKIVKTISQKKEDVTLCSITFLIQRVVPLGIFFVYYPVPRVTPHIQFSLIKLMKSKMFSFQNFWIHLRAGNRGNVGGNVENRRLWSRGLSYPGGLRLNLRSRGQDRNPGGCVVWCWLSRTLLLDFQVTK